MNVSIFKLCKELLKISTEILPDPITRNLLKALIDSISEQTANMNQKLDKILAAPYKNGLDFLTSAERVNDPALKRENIGNALEQFVDASNKAVTIIAKAQSLFYVGVCYNLFKEPHAALLWYERAYQTGWDHRITLVESLNNSNVIPAIASFPTMMGISSTIAAAIGIGIAAKHKLIDMSNVSSLLKKTPEFVRASITAKQNQNELIYLDQNLLMPLKALLQAKSSSLAIVQEPLERWEYRGLL